MIKALSINAKESDVVVWPSNNFNPRKRHNIYIYISNYLIPCKAKHTTGKAWEPAKAAPKQPRLMLQWHNRNIPTLEAHYCQLGDLYRLKTEAFQFSSSFISQRTGVSFPTAPALLLLYAFTLNSIRRTLLFFLVVESSRCLLFFVLLRGEELYSIRWMIGRRWFFSLFCLPASAFSCFLLCFFPLRIFGFRFIVCLIYWFNWGNGKKLLI